MDEASQIELGDYIPLMVDHSTTLKKVVFIGDDKQRAFSISVSKTRSLKSMPSSSLRRGKHSGSQKHI